MRFTRREFVATGIASAGVAGLAGCLGDDGEIVLEGEAALEAPVAGDPDADVTVMAFEDFGCGGCRSFKLNVFPFIENSYIEPGEIRYEHRDFPIPANSTWSWSVASAARSVYEHEGNDAFWEFTNRIYEDFGEYSYEGIEDAADELGFDGEQVRQDAEAGTYRDGVETERERASDAGIGSTPTVVVDGSVVDDPFDSDELFGAIDDALE
ncbi:thioredoxin domain-containing protein [Natrialbaceae archaeon A-gly3]